MCTRFFPWKYMPDIFCKLQYPWRMLGFFIFFASVLSGINLQLIIEKISKKETINIILAVFSIAIITFLGIHTVSKFIQRDKERSEEKYTLEGYTRSATVDETYENSIMENKKISHMSINREYLPVKALVLQHTYMMERENKIYVLSGNASIYDEYKDNIRLTAKIENLEENTILELPYLYYPGYKITVQDESGKIMELNSEESENGYLSTRIEGIKNGLIKVEYIGSQITKISYILSMISIVAFAIYIYLYIKIYSKK